MSREHLQKVLSDQRESKALLARYRALRAAPRKQTPNEDMSSETNPRFSQEPTPAPQDGHPALIDPADANTSMEWVELCAKLGFTTVVVQARYSPELWHNAGFEERLGSELTEANLGHYDSARYGNPIGFFFYLHGKKLADGLRLIEARLSAIGLLPHVKIGVADLELKGWRVVYPECEKAGA